MKKALIVIDIQNEYFANASGNFPQWNAEPTAHNIAEKIRTETQTGTLIAGVQHIFNDENAVLFRANTPNVAIHKSVEALLADKPLVVKHHADAFLNTDLTAILQANSITDIDICGMMTQNCVTHTAISPQAKDYRVRVIADCCTAPSELIHSIALNALADRVEVV